MRHAHVQVNMAFGGMIRNTRIVCGKMGDDAGAVAVAAAPVAAPPVMGSQRPSKRARSMAALVSEEVLAAAKTAEQLYVLPLSSCLCA
jgi:hypothetical protein